MTKWTSSTRPTLWHEAQACNECDQLCTDILAGPQPEERVERVQPLEAMTDEQILDHAPRILIGASRIECELGLALGSSLGMTCQSAWERFSGKE